jgi:hypothetical protein
MAESKKPVIVQTVELRGSGRLVRKSDNKWYYQTVTGGVVTTETPVKASEAREAQRSGQPAFRGTTADLERQIRMLEAVVPSANGRYTYGGKTYTSAGWDKLVKGFRDQLAGIRSSSETKEAEARVAETQQASQRQRDAEIRRVRVLRDWLQQAVVDFRDESETAMTVPAQDNLTKWSSFYKTKLDELNRYLSGLQDGSMSVGSVNTDFQQVSFDQGSRSAPMTQGMETRPAAAPVSDATAPGVIPPSGLTAGARGEMGIDRGTGRPVVAPTGQPETPAVTETPQTPATPATSTGQTPARTGTVPTGGSTGGTVGGTTGGAVPPTGVTPGAPAAPAAGTWNIPADWEKAAREAYGSYYDAIKNIPELRDFINELMTGPILSDPQFKAKLQQTNWWKTTTAAARDFVRRQVEDPATLQTQIDNSKADMRQRALALGLSVDDATLTKVVTDQIKFGWGEQVTLDYLGQQSLGTTEGAARLRQGFYGQQVREKAAQYGIPLSDVTFTNWVSKIATGSENLTSFETYVREQAKVLYPALSNGLDRGLSFTDLTSPYAVQASRILEIPAEQIDFSDPRWARAFTSRNDKGEQIQMSYGEWADYLRSDPSFGWEYTDQAKSQAYDLALEIGKMFGRAG